MSRVLVNNLCIRKGPSTNAEKIPNKYYNAGEIINSGEALIKNDDRTWLKYTSSTGEKRYICAIDKDGTKFIEVPINIQSTSNGETGVKDIPRQKHFPDERIQKEGCCFLCTCVKGGLITYEQCVDCFNWGMNSGKLRKKDCFVLCEKEDWAKEISEKYKTTYHGDYLFQNNGKHFWLTKNGVEIFNSGGIGWRG